MLHFQAAAPALPGSVGAIGVSLPKGTGTDREGIKGNQAVSDTENFPTPFFVKCVVVLISSGLGTKNS